MARRPNVTPSIPLQVMLPKPDHTQITQHLWSELEERVPVGAYQSFFVKLTRFFFDTKELDLSPYFGTMPGESIIRARSVDIERIRAALAASPLTKEPTL